MEVPSDDTNSLGPAEEVASEGARQIGAPNDLPLPLPPALHAVLPEPCADVALKPGRRGPERQWRTYAALDLGTNNCRLLIARPSRRGFQVVDAFSRIIRLGEGVSTTGRLCDAAMDRTWDALKVCAAKMRRHNVARARLVATEACRAAKNGPEFIERVRRELGLHIEILSREAEAKLAVSGCATLLDDNSDLALVFDIGGGSSELVWLWLLYTCTSPRDYAESGVA